MAAAPWLAVAIATAFVLAMAPAAVTAKECTNVPTQLSSHTVRARLQGTPAAEEWRLRELFHDHVNPAEESTWMDLLPLASTSTAGEESDWAMLYRALKGGFVSSSSSSAAAEQQQQHGRPPVLEEVSLHDVRLDPGDEVYGRAQQTNLEYLLLLEVDRLVWSFRRQAGLPAPGAPYGGWEAADVELRGHFVGTYTAFVLTIRRRRSL
jgi:hypothetical protein